MQNNSINRLAQSKAKKRDNEASGRSKSGSLSNSASLEDKYSIFEKSPRGDMGGQRATKRSYGRQYEWNKMEMTGPNEARPMYTEEARRRMMAEAERKRAGR